MSEQPQTFTYSDYLDSGITLGRENVYQRVRVPVQSDTSVGFQQLSVEGRKYTHIIVASGRRPNDTSVLVNHLNELTNDERHGLDSLHLVTESVTVQHFGYLSLGSQ